MKASRYAKVVPVLRTLKGGLADVDKIRELASSGSVGEVIAGLRETIYAPAVEAKTPDEASRLMYEIYWGIVGKIASRAPPEAQDHAFSFVRVDEISDLVVIAYRIARGMDFEGSFITASVKESTVSKLLANPEAASSLQRLVESIPKWAKGIIADAIEVFNAARDPMVFAYYRPLAKARVLYEPLASLDRYSLERVLRVLCPLIRSEAAAAAIEASAAGIRDRGLEAAWSVEVTDYCGVDWKGLAELASREEDPSGVAASVKRMMPDVRVEGRTPLEQAASARQWGRRESRRRAEAEFYGYPFHAGLIAAGLLLLRMEMEDLRTILLSAKYRLEPERYAVLLTRQGVA
ncbi:V-type ATPase subunit [Stetteria hydrogenophila]